MSTVAALSAAFVFGLMNLALFLFGPLPVESINEDQVDQAISRLVARGKLKGGTGKGRGQLKTLFFI